MGGGEEEEEGERGEGRERREERGGGWGWSGVWGARLPTKIDSEQCDEEMFLMITDDSTSFYHQED
jgi:hypothetical protein